MDNQYNFNGKYKRFEPVETHCVFCNERHSTEMNKNYFPQLFQEGKRKDYVVYRSVQYSKLRIGIPRCKKCYTIHDNMNMLSRGFTYLLAIAVPVLIILNAGISVTALIIASVWFIGVIVFMPNFLIKLFVHLRGIKTEKEGEKEDKSVQEFLKAGWSLFQPTA